VNGNLNNINSGNYTNTSSSSSTITNSSERTKSYNESTKNLLNIEIDSIYKNFFSCQFNELSVSNQKKMHGQFKQILSLVKEFKKENGSIIKNKSQGNKEGGEYKVAIKAENFEDNSLQSQNQNQSSKKINSNYNLIDI